MGLAAEVWPTDERGGKRLGELDGMLPSDHMRILTSTLTMPHSISTPSLRRETTSSSSDTYSVTPVTASGFKGNSRTNVQVIGGSEVWDITSALEYEPLR